MMVPAIPSVEAAMAPVTAASRLAMTWVALRSIRRPFMTLLPRRGLPGRGRLCPPCGKPKVEPMQGAGRFRPSRAFHRLPEHGAFGHILGVACGGRGNPVGTSRQVADDGGRFDLPGARQARSSLRCKAAFARQPA